MVHECYADWIKTVIYQVGGGGLMPADSHASAWSRPSGCTGHMGALEASDDHG